MVGVRGLPAVERRGRLAAMSPKRGSTVLVTVLFTDIVGSTEIAAEMGDRRWRELVQRHHAVVRRGLKHFLDSEGDLEVVGEAEGGAQALDLLARLASEERQPDVVLMDLKMEPLDGIESTRQIRARYSEVEVVALTSFGEEERVHAALEAGASGYLLKDSDADEVSVEAYPETVTPSLARLLSQKRVNRVSLGAQSFQPRLLSVLERHAQPEDVRRAFYDLRDASFDNISLDLIYGIPGQSAADLDHDLAEALALAPEHLSLYELEAKSGTRFTHAWGRELERQAVAMEAYLECVVEFLVGNGYRWYETANFCLEPERAQGRDLRARHNLAYWLGRDYLGLGIGAVSTVGGVRWRNAPSLARYTGALATGARPPREAEELDELTRAWERAMLGLRLDEELPLGDVEGVVEQAALVRLAELGLLERSGRGARGSVRLTPRGRMLGDAVTVELLAARY